MKSFTKQIMVLAMALLVSVQVSAYDFEVDGLYYNVVSTYDLTAEVTYGDNRNNTYSGDVVIPETAVYKGRTLRVIGIGGGAFQNCSSLASVVLPNSVTSIGGGAFYGCSSLTSVVLPNGVTTIGMSAFQECSSLASVVIPNSVTSIGADAFEGCSTLASVELPNSLTTIETAAFENCSSLVSVVLPNGVTAIGDETFRGCSSLASMVLPNSVTTIGWCTFYGCSSLTSVVIPNGVTTIGNSAFSGCSSLASVVIPNSVTTIGEHAFFGCCSLASMVIPNSVVEIGEDAFTGCSNLNTFILGTGVSTLPKGLFCSFSSKPSMVSPVSKLHISDSPNALNMECFPSGGNGICFELYYLPLKELYVGRILQLDVDYRNPSSLNVIPKDLEKIEYGGSMKSDNCYRFEDGRMGGCSAQSAQTIIYGDSIEKINHPSRSVSEIYLRCPTPPQSEEWSNDNYLNTIVYVPKGTLSAYQSADVWKNFWEIREWDATTGIETPTEANGYAVTASGRQITVRTDGQRVRVRVYNAAGRLLYDGGEGTVTVNAPGLYIVRAGDHTEKLLIK